MPVTPRIKANVIRKATLLLLLLAALTGCDMDDHYHGHYPICYDLEPGRRLTGGELHALEHALERRLRVDFDDDLSFRNPIGPDAATASGAEVSGKSTA